LDGSLRDLFKIRRHMVNLMLMVYIWVASSFDLYLVNYSIKNLPGDFFMNQLISSCSDIFVAILGGYAYHKMGLRLVQSVFFTVSVIGGILILILGESH
jgi:hypothetical protein